MKKCFLLFLLIALINTFSFGQLASPQTLGSGDNQVKLAEVDNSATDITLDLSPSTTVESQSIMRLRVYPGGTSNAAFFGLGNSSDRDNVGFVRLGARESFGILGIVNRNSPTTPLKHYAIELDPRDDQTGESFVITSGGFVGTSFGTAETFLMKVDASGVSTIEAKVQATVAAPDYVFKEDYRLRSLDEVEQFINKNSHLPEIPSAAEFEKDGITLGKMSFDLLKKVEELTLYLIDLKKENESLKSRVKELEKR